MADTSKLIRYFEASGSGEEARRMLDLAEQVVKGRPYRVADFTSPAGLVIADAIKANYPQIIVKTDGGYEGAERIRIAFVDSDFNGTVDMGIRALKVNWDPRFRLLTHRDVLGSLMGLGIDRSKFGDVIVQQGGAQIMVDESVADFVIQNFTKIAMVSVSVEAIELSDIAPKEEKIKELQNFIARFSANASKSKQATSRKKLLDKITLDDIQPSSRKYPFVGFKPEREVGNDILEVNGISKTVDGVKLLDNVSFRVNKDDKIAFVGNERSITTLFKIINGEMEPDSGDYKWGVTITNAYFPKDNTEFFDGCELNLVDWLRQFSDEKSESYLRGFLGRMLFSGEEALKQASVLSGGEKVRCMLSKLMLSSANVLTLDQPTNHLDLESITAVNNGLADYKSVLLFACHDHQFVETIANRIIELTPEGIKFDKVCTYDEYLETK